MDDILGISQIKCEDKDVEEALFVAKPIIDPRDYYG